MEGVLPVARRESLWRKLNATFRHFAALPAISLLADPTTLWVFCWVDWGKRFTLIVAGCASSSFAKSHIDAESVGGFQETAEFAAGAIEQGARVTVVIANQTACIVDAFQNCAVCRRGHRAIKTE